MSCHATNSGTAANPKQSKRKGNNTWVLSQQKLQKTGDKPSKAARERKTIFKGVTIDCYLTSQQKSQKTVELYFGDK